MDPGIISGAGLISLIKKGMIGNAKAGKGEWLIIEADESDGSIVQYKPEIGVLLNIDKDHQEIEELKSIFQVFKNNSHSFSVNVSHTLTRTYSQDIKHDFSTNKEQDAGYIATDFQQQGLAVNFKINGELFELNLLGRHNMENAVAATCVANQIGVGLAVCAEALKNYEGIYRRHQVYGKKNGVWLIDDYAHNPVKCAAAIHACQPVSPRVIAWFQPHGYKPTKFLRKDFVKELAAALREQDEIWMSEIFYVGGTTTKDISANDLITDLKALGKKAFFVENRENFLSEVRPHLKEDSVLLLMAARDPSLEEFAKRIWQDL
jgi:UDP-N-acetylmuramate--alanine ligase